MKFRYIGSLLCGLMAGGGREVFHSVSPPLEPQGKLYREATNAWRRLDATLHNGVRQFVPDLWGRSRA